MNASMQATARADGGRDTDRTEHPQTAWQIFRVPLYLAISTAFGLICALLGDEIWDALSWATLLVPIGVATFALLRARARSRAAASAPSR